LAGVDGGYKKVKIVARKQTPLLSMYLENVAGEGFRSSINPALADSTTKTAGSLLVQYSPTILDEYRICEAQTAAYESRTPVRQSALVRQAQPSALENRQAQRGVRCRCYLLHYRVQVLDQGLDFKGVTKEK
jgi:hypothetical protein